MVSSHRLERLGVKPSSQRDVLDDKGKNLEENCTEAGAGIESINRLLNDHYNHQWVWLNFMEKWACDVNVWSWLKDKVSNHSNFQG